MQIGGTFLYETDFNTVTNHLTLCNHHSDPYLTLMFRSVGKGLCSHSFTCPSACTEENLNNPITVIREYLHTHEIGTRIVNEQIRDGVTVRQASAEVWEFNQDGIMAIQQNPYQVLPGDSFRTTCYYRAGDGQTKFGRASNEEMCTGYLYYYPRLSTALDCPFDLQATSCSAEYARSEELEESHLERQFGQCSIGSCRRYARSPSMFLFGGKSDNC